MEIGPGTGNLTKSIIASNPKHLTVVEKDNKLIDYLKNNFDYKNNFLNILNYDILNFNFEKELKNDSVIFGNLPYNISTQILIKLITQKKWPPNYSKLVLMFQKEVADRIISNYNSSKYGRLSILANWKLDIKKIFDISPKSFSPKPKVDSTLLLFSPKKEFNKFKNPYNLEKITRIFFSHRRKMIKKPYNLVFPNNTDVLKKLNLDLNLRPQNLDFETYYKLTNEYEKLRG